MHGQKNIKLFPDISSLFHLSYDTINYLLHS